MKVSVEEDRHPKDMKRRAKYAVLPWEPSPAARGPFDSSQMPMTWWPASTYRLVVTFLKHKCHPPPPSRNGSNVRVRPSSDAMAGNT